MAKSVARRWSQKKLAAHAIVCVLLRSFVRCFFFSLYFHCHSPFLYDGRMLTPIFARGNVFGKPFILFRCMVRSSSFVPSSFFLFLFFHCPILNRVHTDHVHSHTKDTHTRLYAMQRVCACALCVCGLIYGDDFLDAFFFGIYRCVHSRYDPIRTTQHIYVVKLRIAILCRYVLVLRCMVWPLLKDPFGFIIIMILATRVILYCLFYRIHTTHTRPKLFLFFFLAAFCVSLSPLSCNLFTFLRISTVDSFVSRRSTIIILFLQF